jgi:hypothetical protein
MSVAHSLTYSYLHFDLVLESCRSTRTHSTHLLYIKMFSYHTCRQLHGLRIVTFSSYLISSCSAIPSQDGKTALDHSKKIGPVRTLLSQAHAADSSTRAASIRANPAGRGPFSRTNPATRAAAARAAAALSASPTSKVCIKSLLPLRIRSDPLRSFSTFARLQSAPIPSYPCPDPSCLNAERLSKSTF